MDRRARRILTLDSGAACAAGVVVVGLHGWLSTLYGLSPRLVLFMGAVNLAYACYSGSLAWRVRRVGGLPRLAVDALVAANLAWTWVCIALSVSHWATLRPLEHRTV